MTGLTGGFTNYYLVKVENPQREEQDPYQAECEDIIRALGMAFDEGCEFKAIWRTAATRQGNGKPGQKALYDAEKRVHYAQASLRQARIDLSVEEPAAAPVKVDVKYTYGEWYPVYRERPLGLRDEAIVTVRRNDGTEVGPVTVTMVHWDKEVISGADPLAWESFKLHKVPDVGEDGWITHGEKNLNAPEWLPRGTMVNVRMANGHEPVGARIVEGWRWEVKDDPASIVSYRPAAWAARV